LLNQERKGKAKMKTSIPEPGQFGPVYNLDSAALKKFRRAGSLDGTLKQFRQAYGAAVEQAVLASQRAALNRAAPSLPRPNCASGTWLSDGREISKAVRAQHRASLAACPSQVRRARSAAVWQAMYDAAMAEKREREALPIAA
jgi:hypothetical protein